MGQVSVLIPAYNESGRIADTLQAVRQIAEDGHIEEIIVVDDGSTDDTSAKAEHAGADIVFRQENRGKGAALQTAYDLSHGKVILLLDADIGCSAAEAVRLIKPALSGAAEMTIATFPVIPGKGGGMGFVVRLARWGIRALTGQTMEAPLSGQRAVRREVIESIGGFADGWGAEIALTVNALRGGFRVLEVPTTMTHRVTGRKAGDIRHRLAQFVAALRVLYQLKATAPREIPAASPPATAHKE